MAKSARKRFNKRGWPQPAKASAGVLPNREGLKKTMVLMRELLIK